MQAGEHDLRKLEYQIDELIQVCKRLQEENNTLRNKQAGLLTERAKLLEKNELARNRVETMILRLKTMEQSS